MPLPNIHVPVFHHDTTQTLYMSRYSITIQPEPYMCPGIPSQYNPNPLRVLVFRHDTTQTLYMSRYSIMIQPKPYMCPGIPS